MHPIAALQLCLKHQAIKRNCYCFMLTGLVKCTIIFGYFDFIHRGEKYVVLLPPSSGDECNQASDNKEVPQDSETAFESACELKVEEDIDDVEEDQIGFLTKRTKRRKRASNKSMCWD